MGKTRYEDLTERLAHNVRGLLKLVLKSIVIRCVYRHPSSDREKFYEILRQKLEYLHSKGYEIGDIIGIHYRRYKYQPFQLQQ